MRRLTGYCIATTLILVAMLSIGCTPTTPAVTPTTAESSLAEEPAVPSILRLRQTEEMTNLDPAFHAGYSDTEPATAIMEGLVAFEPDEYELVNVLAESIEPSEDGLRIDFKLREGVQFQQGYGELTAEDVKFSYERYLDEELASPYAGDWIALDHVEVTGEYTGSIVLNEPFVALFSGTLPTFSGLIVSKTAMEELGPEEFARNPVGTGPYEIVEIVPNERLVVKRFEDYWGEPPEWDEIWFMPIVEDSAAEIALETGELDFGRISPSAAERFREGDGFQTIALPTMAHHGVAINVLHPKLQDINVRRAISYAIDAPSIIEAAYGGEAERACTILSPASPAYWEDAPCPERDLERAKDYLAQAGLESLDLTLATENLPHSQVAAEIVQANLADIGINVEVEVLDSATYYEGGFGDSGIQERELTWINFDTVSPDPYWAIQWFLCGQVGEWNFAYWCNEEFDALHYDALQEPDWDTRLEMYHEMLQIWHDDVSVVWVAHPVNVFAGRADLAPAQSPTGQMMPQYFHSK